MTMELVLVLIIVVLAVGIIGALIYVRTKVSKNVIKHVRAKLARIQKQNVRNLRDLMGKSIRR